MRLLKYLYIWILALYSVSAYTQETPTSEFYNQKGDIQLRAQLGTNISTEVGELANLSTFGIGFLFGGSIGYYFNPQFSVRSSLLFTRRSFSSDFGSEPTFRFNFVSFPVMLEYQLDKFSIFLGRHLNLLLKAEAQTQNGDPRNLISTERRLRLGTDVGLGYRISDKLMVEGHLQITNDLFTPNLSLVSLF